MSACSVGGSRPDGCSCVESRKPKAKHTNQGLWRVRIMKQRILEDVASASAHLSGLTGAYSADIAFFHEVVAAMHAVCSCIAAAERATCDAAAIRDASWPAHQAHAQSPFVRRLQTWPRGYPGDFETIEYLLSQRVQVPCSTFGYWVEYYALGTLIAQQHRNKVAAQGRELARVLSSCPRTPRILVIAAGSSPDLALVEGLIRDRECRVVLNDGDQEALAFSQNRLAAVAHLLHPVHGNAITSAAKLASLGPFDLVLAGGLLDYFPDRLACLLIRSVWRRLLAPGGRFYFTNIGQNPYRVWMEYMANWRLIERSDAELNQLVTSACGPNAAFSAEREPTGLSWLVSVDRPA